MTRSVVVCERAILAKWEPGLSKGIASWTEGEVWTFKRIASTAERPLAIVSLMVKPGVATCWTGYAAITARRTLCLIGRVLAELASSTPMSGGGSVVRRCRSGVQKWCVLVCVLPDR